MSLSSDNVAAYVYDTLTSDATLSAIVTDWYKDIAKQSAVSPYGVFSFPSIAGSYAFANNLTDEEILILFKVTTRDDVEGSSPNEIVSSAINQLNVLLDGNQVTNDGKYLQFRRINEAPMTEPNTGDVLYVTHRALYRVTVS